MADWGARDPANTVLARSHVAIPTFIPQIKRSALGRSLRKIRRCRIGFGASVNGNNARLELIRNQNREIENEPHDSGGLLRLGLLTPFQSRRTATVEASKKAKKAVAPVGLV